MKKILLVLIMLITINSYADDMPGFLELDINAQRWSNTFNGGTYLNTELSFKYGVSHDWFQPYIFGNTKTFFQTTVYFDKNHPFRDVYTVGLGLRIYKTLYIEAGHTCSHFVESHNNQERLYNSFTKYKHNHIKVGLNFKID
jgi:hypothetical protein